MFRKSQFGLVFNTLFSGVFSLLITLFIKAVSGSLTFENVCTGFCQGFSVNFTLGSFIPLLPMGNAFARLFTKKENSLGFYLLRMLAIVVVICALMCFFMMFIDMGFSPYFWKAYFSSVPGVLAVAYVAASLGFPFLFKATNVLCSKEG